MSDGRGGCIVAIIAYSWFCKHVQATHRTHDGGGAGVGRRRKFQQISPAPDLVVRLRGTMELGGSHLTRSLLSTSDQWAVYRASVWSRMKSRHSGADGQLRRRPSGAVGRLRRSTSGRPANRSGEGARVGGPRWRDHGVTHAVMPETMEGTTRPSKRFHAAAHLFACAAVAHTLGGPPRGEAKFKVHPLARWSDLYPGPVHVQSWWQETPSLS